MPNRFLPGTRVRDVRTRYSHGKGTVLCIFPAINFSKLGIRRNQNETEHGELVAVYFDNVIRLDNQSRTNITVMLTDFLNAL